jgi:hypothetical protein
MRHSGSQQGFPDEATIGVFVKQDTMLDYSGIDAMVRHAYLRKYFGLSPSLLKALNEGKIHPERFFAWYEMELNHKKQFEYGNAEPFVVINGNVYLHKPAKPMELVDRNRWSLLNTGFDRFSAKVSYKSFGNGKHTNFIIGRWGGVAIYEGLSPEAEAMMARTMVKTALKL